MKFRYSDKQIAFLKTWYRHWKISKLTERFNLRFGLNKTPEQIKSALNNHNISCGRKCGNKAGEYRLFSKRQATEIRRLIKKHTHAEIAGLLNEKHLTSFTERQIHFFTANHRINSGRTGYFNKGHIPWNAGTKGLTGRNKTSFKKGHRPANYRHVGAERVCSKDGYILIKIKEKDPHTTAKTRYKHKHIVLWEKKHGPVPKGCVIIFKDGNMYNFRLNNLVCISRSEHVRLNQMHYKQQPKKLKSSVFALAKLKARIGELSR